MLQKVRKNLDQLNMISQGDLVLAGVSGGADSVALLLLLESLKEELGFALEVVHVEHGIRGEESLQDASFVKNLSKELHLPCHVIPVDVPEYCKEQGLGTEEAARILRYEAFSNLAKEKHAKVALAHHMEDNAETILFQMLRGSSLTGLCGMQPVRRDSQGVVYIRPLLSLHRQEIEEFLKAQGQGYCTDSTNAEVDYRRNFIRNEVFPKLSQINVRAVSHINQTASHLSLVKDYMNVEVEKNWSLMVSKAIGEKDVYVLDVSKLMELHPVLQQEIAHRVIAEVAGAKKDISTVHVEALLKLCENQSGREVHLPYGVVAKKEFEYLRLFVDEKEAVSKTNIMVSEDMLKESFLNQEACEVIIGDKGEKLVFQVLPYNGESTKIEQKTYTKWLDYDKIKKGFCIRTRQSGDYFIGDVLGHHKKLKQYFIDEKIPATERDRRWLLANDHEVLWLIGGRISEHVKLTEDTKLVVKLNYTGGR